MMAYFIRMISRFSMLADYNILEICSIQDKMKSKGFWQILAKYLWYKRWIWRRSICNNISIQELILVDILSKEQKLWFHSLSFRPHNHKLEGMSGGHQVQHYREGSPEPHPDSIWESPRRSWAPPCLRITKAKLGSSIFLMVVLLLQCCSSQSWAALCHTALENTAYIGYGCCLHVALWVGLNLRVLWWGVGASNTNCQKQAAQQCGRGVPGALLWVSGGTTMAQLLQRLLDMIERMQLEGTRRGNHVPAHVGSHRSGCPRLWTIGFHVLQGKSPPALWGQPVARLSHRPSKRLSPCVGEEPAVIQLVPIVITLSLGTTHR